MGKDLLYPLRRIHGVLHEWKQRQTERRDLRKCYGEMYNLKKSNNPKTVFLVLTPEHSNLGDHAIALSETQLLEEFGIDYVEITEKQLVEMQKYKCLNVMNGCPILINGGGNLGTLWYNVEQLIRNIITSNPQSPIFIMPSTIYYDDSEWGNGEFERSKSIYNAHKKLHIFARESISLKTMRGAYKSTELVPDMVLSLDWSGGDTVRKGCLLCIRNDCEKLCTKQEEHKIHAAMCELFGDDIRYTDMHAASAVPIAERVPALAQKCAEFRGASLVITDRLHGMIFCAISGTPCIVINSRSPKLKGCYEWVRHLEYIKFCDDISDILAVYHSIPVKNHTYDNSKMLRQHRALISEIAETI